MGLKILGIVNKRDRGRGRQGVGSGWSARFRYRGGVNRTVGMGCVGLQRGIWGDPRGVGGGVGYLKVGSDKVWEIQ